MRIKVFKADDLKAAMEMVKQELGEDAVILHTKRVKESRLLGLKSKEVVEVTAAVEDAAAPAPAPVSTPIATPRPRVKKRQGLTTTRQTPRNIPKIDIQSTPPPISVLTQYKTAGTQEGVAQSAELAAHLSGEDEYYQKETKPPVKATRTSTNKVVKSASSAKNPSAHPQTAAAQRKKTVPPPEINTSFQPIAAPKITPEVVDYQEYYEDYTEPAPAYDEYPTGYEENENFAPSVETVPPRIIRAATKKPPAPPASKKKSAPSISSQDTRQKQNEKPLPPTAEKTEIPPDQNTEREKISELEKEITQLRAMLKEAIVQNTASSSVVTLRDILNGQDIAAELIEDMIRRMPQGSLLLDSTSPEAMDALTRYIKNLLKEPGGITLKDNRSRIVALVGTTGVGKTTTLAKIAAKFVLERGVGVALITADTYRISAVDQLKTYSDIIGLPLEIVYSPAELKSALRKFRTKQLVLIDTAGRSQHNEYQMQELAELLSAEPTIEKHLVLSATTKERDASNIIERFSAVKPDRLLFTKTDETESLGLVMNTLYRRKTPISYLTNGQSVPDDIEAASAEIIAKMILKSP